VLRHTRADDNVARLQAWIHRSRCSGEQNHRRLELGNQQRRDDRGVDLPGAGTADDNLSSAERSDSEDVSVDVDLTAVLEASLDRTDLRGDAEDAHDGLRERVVRDEKKENRERNRPSRSEGSAHDYRRGSKASNTLPGAPPKRM
jgi:hypothetical protein